LLFTTNAHSHGYYSSYQFTAKNYLLLNHQTNLNILKVTRRLVGCCLLYAHVQSITFTHVSSRPLTLTPLSLSGNTSSMCSPYIIMSIILCIVFCTYFISPVKFKVGSHVSVGSLHVPSQVFCLFTEDGR
jgi:hypothetical protein